MPTLEWIGKNKVINHHQEVPFRVLERRYSYDESGQHLLSALSLLVFGVLANYHNATLALNDFALLAHGFNGRSYLHTV